ncbi:hypothetical protein KPH14_007876 [Odynerus spinipes]|uniref:Inosine/uridine-preferring nucleoside hydrolase domain-containing protein n=1 Tax=Odynerus spinipes TaxID=1348599 RepID=A0AAD9S1M1_9HYME|nr:hypothetical protein KPH14_007876 [Odynerus spinipes]
MTTCCIAFIIILLHALSSNTRYAVAHEKVIIDTDAGADDALGILLALAHEKSTTNEDFKILAITCVYGNTYLNNVEQNVLKTLTIAGRSDVPVYSGNHKPLVYNFTASDYFGKDGLGDFEFDKQIIGTINRTKHASLAIIDLVKQYPGEVTIICLGPVTNIATAIILEPNFLKYVKNIFIMGGSVNGIGNQKPSVEYNFSMDPESNFIVLNSTTQTPSTLLPWETCSTGAISLEWRNNVFGKLNSSTVTFLNKAESISLNKESAWHPADVITVATMIWPDIILQSTVKNVYPVVDGIARGSVLVDYTESTGRTKNAKIVQEYNVEKFQDILLHYFQ